jgi:hypothetical protein
MHFFMEAKGSPGHHDLSSCAMANLKRHEVSGHCAPSGFFVSFEF